MIKGEWETVKVGSLLTDRRALDKRLKWSISKGGSFPRNKTLGKPRTPRLDGGGLTSAPSEKGRGMGWAGGESLPRGRHRQGEGQPESAYDPLLCKELTNLGKFSRAVSLGR